MSSGSSTSTSTSGSLVIDIRDSNHWDEVFANAKAENSNVICDFYADWCGPCRRVAPILAQLSVAKKDYRVIFIKVKKDAPNLNKLQKWYKSDIQNDIISLESYCHQYAQNFFLDDNTWLLFDDLLKEVPIVTYNKEDYLKQHTFIELEDTEFKYFINIKGFKIKNSLSPLSFEIESIRNIIVNKRKLELINKMKKDIYEDAEIKKDFEIYKSK
jgi:thiol-disulfide isomerase/thioredoxin